LLQAMTELLSHDVIEHVLKIAPAQGQLRAELYQLGAVLDEQVDDHGGLTLKLRIEAHNLKRLVKKAGLDLYALGLEAPSDAGWV